jgi:hypothetical protein
MDFENLIGLFTHSMLGFDRGRVFCASPISHYLPAPRFCTLKQYPFFGKMIFKLFICFRARNGFFFNFGIAEFLYVLKQSIADFDLLQIKFALQTFLFSSRSGSIFT